MHFEGAEKKFELIVRGASFRARPAEFWHRLVERSEAKILSRIANEACDAYLLSESSLFVWDDRVTMITCGRTTLARALVSLLESEPMENVEFLTFERKNEFFPAQQATDFHDDVERIKRLARGKSFRFGSPNEHHLHLFHLDKPFRARGADTTLEILMYDLQGPDVFSGGQTLERVRELTKVDQIFPGFQIDDYLFDPCGYSLNAIRGPEYYTIHVTPEETGSYVSFETNVRLGAGVQGAIRNVTEVFRPRAFDVIYFHPERELSAFELEPFTRRAYTRQSLSCGFELGYATYYLKSDRPDEAVRLED